MDKEIIKALSNRFIGRTFTEEEKKIIDEVFAVINNLQQWNMKL